jgi:PPOX class probable F420-dependent enzyme
MASKVLDKFMDLLTQKVAFANLATLMPDGSPQVTPLWFEYKDGAILINTAVGRRKARNLDTNPKVALAISDPANPYRYIQIRGHVTRSTKEGADAHIDSLAKRYLGQDKYPFRGPGEVRIMYEIAIDSCQGNG